MGERDQQLENEIFPHRNYIRLKYSGKTVLDVGGANGNLISHLIKTSKCYVLDVDKSSNQIKGIEHVIGSMTNIPFKDKTFDYILCHASLHHKPESLGESLFEINRVSKDESKIVICDPIRNNPINIFRRFSKYPHEDEKPFSYKEFEKEIFDIYKFKILVSVESIFSYMFVYFIPLLKENYKKPLRKFALWLNRLDCFLLGNQFFWNFCGYVSAVVYKDG